MVGIGRVRRRHQRTRRAADRGRPCGAGAGRVHGRGPAATALALLGATDRFHGPHYAGEWEQPGVETEFGAVVRPR
ncbi:hypothetical protein ACWCQZ_04745 [Streptomyces sp. NPDC002285]